MLLILSIAWAFLVGGLVARAVIQYRHYTIVRPQELARRESAPPVSVIVPARNEEKNIGGCIEAILKQDYPPEKLKLIVIDDNSEDRTAAIVRETAGSDSRVQLLSGEPLPPGWLGKPWACSRGAAKAEGEWLCFIDADTVAFPPLIGSAVSLVSSRGLDLLSLQPFQQIVSFGERLLLPTGFFLIAFTQDIRRTNDPAFPDAAVNGQFLFIRRSAYEAVGGHGAVAGAIAEDSALARRMKAAGQRIFVCGTEGLLHTRMYSNFRALWEGTARQAAQLLTRAILPWIALAALILAWASMLLPLADLLSGPRWIAFGFALAGTLTLLGVHIGAARYFRIPFWYGLLYPAGYSLGAAVLIFAAWQSAKRQTRWKGRVYEAASA